MYTIPASLLITVRSKSKYTKFDLSKHDTPTLYFSMEGYEFPNGDKTFQEVTN